jgi:DNA polymerase-3 subunit beta
MDITIPKKDLLRLANRAKAVVSKKPTMPILSCVLLEADAETLTLKATDLTQSVRGTVPAEVRRQGSIALNASDLAVRVSAMPDGPILVSTDEKRATLKAAGSARRFTLETVAASEYPALPDPPEEAQRLDLSAERLKRLVALVAYAVSPDDTRANLSSLLVEWHQEGIRTVATDGHRLSKVEMPQTAETRASMLVPRAAALEFLRLADEARSAESQVVTLIVGEREVYLDAGGVLYGSKLVEAQFPAYSKVIPKPDGRHVATVPRALLADAIKAVSLAANDRTNGVHLVFAEGVLRVTSESPTSGDGADEVAADYAGPGLTIGVNGRYLLDVLGVLESTEVTIAHGGELDPLTLMPVGIEGEEFVGVVMPMRILGGCHATSKAGNADRGRESVAPTPCRLWRRGQRQDAAVRPPTDGQAEDAAAPRSRRCCCRGGLAH